MRFIFPLVILFAVTMAACSESSGREVTDTPRYTADEAKGLIRDQAKTNKKLIGSDCASQGPRYRGNGIWACGLHWTVDERLGKAFYH